MSFAGKEWIKQVVIGATLFPVFISGIAFLINFIAIYYHASRAIPFFTMVCSMGYVFHFSHLLSSLGCYGLYLRVCDLATNSCGYYSWAQHVGPV